VKYLGWAFLCVLILTGWSGCEERPKPPAEAPIPPATGTTLPDDGPKPGKDGKVSELEQAKYDARKYKELSAQADARYSTLKKQADEDALRSQVMWISGIALLVAAIAGVAAFLVPVGKKTLVSLAIGCVVIAACAQAFRVAVPYLPWIGGVLLLGGGVWAAFNWKKLGAAVQNASDHGDRLEDWLRTDLLPNLDDTARETAEKLIADAKTETKQAAQRMGVHKTVQTLRGKLPSLWQRINTKIG
jgi:hypothetical protein